MPRINLPRIGGSIPAAGYHLFKNFHARAAWVMEQASPSTETAPQSLAFAVASDTTQQVNDKSDHEDCAEYAADVHVNLQGYPAA